MGPTAQATAAVVDFIGSVRVLPNEDDGGLIILIPVMGAGERLIHYRVSPNGTVTQHITKVAAGGVPPEAGSTGTRTEPGEIAPPAANGSVYDMLDRADDADEGDVTPEELGNRDWYVDPTSPTYDPEDYGGAVTDG